MVSGAVLNNHITSRVIVWANRLFCSLVQGSFLFLDMLRGIACAGAYRDAYMSLSAAAVFAPFVRLELLNWDPIFTGVAGIANPALCASPLLAARYGSSYSLASRRTFTS